MLILETAAVAFSMFSALPVPQPVWNQRNMRYAMCAFPLVGLVLGALWWCWAALCCRLALPELLRGAGLCLLPVAVTGGIHLDGYADTSDALASHAPPERRREILSDSHCGAFAIIRLCTYFVGYFALCTAVDPTEPAALCMGLSFALSRAMSGFAITAFPLAKDTGLAHTFASAAHRGRARYTRHCYDGSGRGGDVALHPHRPDQIRWDHRRPGRLVYAESGILDAGGAGGLPAGGGAAMIFITGPLFAGKRQAAMRLLGWSREELEKKAVWDVQDLAPNAEELEALARRLSDYPVVIATEVGGGVVPADPAERVAREAAGRLSCLLAQRAQTVVRVFCGIPTVLKGALG